MAARARYPVVVFDLDGTLLRGTTVSLYLAERMGHGAELAELERRFLAGEITNSVVADASAPWFVDHETKSIQAWLAEASWIDGMAEALETLAAAGSRLLLGTITWRFAARMLQERHGFEDVSGTEMGERDGVLDGRVSGYFDLHDKARWVADWCAERGIDLSKVAAVGDSRSDVPLFGRVGFSIALNATDAARAAADVAVDTEDLREILPLLLDAT
jgi:phosphoserine phosphatase